MNSNHNVNYQREYIKRINNVIDYINNHLNEKLTLEILSKIANFSIFHFHRIFKLFTNESLYAYIKRIRLEKAANLILHLPYQPILDIALDCGFSSQSNFSSAFKSHYGVSATEFRKNYGFLENSKNSKMKSKNTKNFNLLFNDLLFHDQKNLRRISEMKIEVKSFPAYQVAYVRHFGSYFKVHVAWQKICQWAQGHNLLKKDSLMIGISHDNPDITEEKNLRYDACIVLEHNIDTPPDISKKTLEQGKYAVCRFEGPGEKIKEGYKVLYKDWLPSSGYQPDDREMFEIYYNDPLPDNHFIMDICLPVKPL